MSFEDLYRELNLDWRPEERSLFVKEIAAAAQSYQSTLGASKADKDKRRALEQSKDRLEDELYSATLEFSKVLEVLPLRKSDYEAQGLQVPTRIAAQMKNFRFYLVNVPITMVSLPGWGFVELECILEFNPLDEAKDRPVAHELLPKEKWQDVVRANQGLQVGLDENLEFQTPKLVEQVLGKTGVNLAARATAGLVLGPFEYRIRRPQIVARGVGNVKARWRLVGEQTIEREEPVLGIVLKVPKHVRQVELIGVLKASGRFHNFTSELRHLKRFLRDRTQRFIDEGAPDAVPGEWDISSYL